MTENGWECLRRYESRKAAEYEATGDFLAYLSRRMVVCLNCGSKRCPHAVDHRNPCPGFR